MPNREQKKLGIFLGRWRTTGEVQLPRQPLPQKWMRLMRMPSRTAFENLDHRESRISNCNGLDDKRQKRLRAGAGRILNGPLSFCRTGKP